MLERGDDGWEQDLDEMEEPEIEAAEMAIEELCTGSSCASVPATNLLQIRVCIYITIHKQKHFFFFKCASPKIPAE